MTDTADVYRNLQQHLDKMPVGYPATESGVEINLLKTIFTPEEAKIVTYLDYKHKGLKQIFEVAREEVSSKDDLKNILDGIVAKGGISRRKRNGKPQYAVVPLVIWGMYEYQLKRLNPEFLMNIGQYLQSEYGYEIASNQIPKMRVIPIEKSVEVGKRIATYDELRQLIEQAGEQITLQECMCRKVADMTGKPCQFTDRREVCMSFGDLGDLYASEGWGRRISRDEALALAQQSEEEGLVLMPENAQEPQFMCACCTDCCGMFGILKNFPKPLAMIATNYFVLVDENLCKGCGTCAKRCPMEEVEIEGKLSTISTDRCIGCGLCVSTCSENAISLVKKSEAATPPETEEHLYDAIMARKKARLENS